MALFPIAEGTGWTYQNNTGQRTSIHFKNAIERGGIRYWIAETDGPGEVLYLPLSDALVRVENPDAEKRQIWVLLRYGLSKGQSWSAHQWAEGSGAKKDRPAYFKVAGEESIASGGQTYERCLRIDFYPAGSPYPVASSWYAPGIGPVRILEQESDWQLAEHQMGKEAGVTNHLTLAQWFDQIGKKDDLLPRTALHFNTPAKPETLRRPIPGLVLYLMPLSLFLFLAVVLLLLRRYLVKESLALGFLAKGNLHLALKKIQDGAAAEALDSLQKNFPAGHHYPDVLYAEGLALQNLQLLDQALEKFTQALNLNPNYNKPLLARAHTLKSLGRFEESERDFHLLLEHKLHYPDVHNALGELLVIRGQREQALWHFQEALRLNPAYRQARENLEKLTI